MARTKIAVYPGSFDPITNGHIDLVERTLRVFNRVIVAIASNPNKDDSLFSVNERLEMIQQVFRAQGKRVQADSFEGLLVDYAEKVGAGVIIRGLRAVSDFEYEFQMAMMNRELRPKLETLFMMTSVPYSYLSSSIVKEVSCLNGPVEGLVPPEVKKALDEKYNR